jgi:N-acetylmuramoyl-L-alanine amidase
MEFPARIDAGDGYYRVRVGNYGSINEAAMMEQRLKRAGYQTVIVS